MATLLVFTTLVLDGLFGEPRRFHPLVGFGRLAQALERCLHTGSRARGGLAVALLLTPFTLLALLIDALPWGGVFDVAVLYLAIGWKSLGEHARRVRDALLSNDLPAARQRVGFMVSRDTETLDAEDVARATVESVLENGNDAVFGAIFWFMLAGAPGVVAYRLANTLDAMWGYRNERYLHFGWAAARLDDVMNFIPARLTALSYALLGNFKRALRCWRSQGTLWKSPNAGPVMAAGAGSLGVVLGGPASYHGAMQARPPLGEGHDARLEDIDRALRLIRHTLLLWVLILLTGGWLVDHVLSA
ncbi:MAG: adenosylcobinamide-phosphate synthase CbiB [Gammaproteobacteria bacterium]|nr:adenosylcobinamide-phosphate synthase CbiB [Gammaproteobacteria bacterium]